MGKKHGVMVNSGFSALLDDDELKDCAFQMNFNPGSLKESLETLVYSSYSNLTLQINYITKTGFTALPLCASAMAWLISTKS